MAEMTDTVKCASCGMDIAPADAASTIVKDGTTLYFCSDGCAAGYAAGHRDSM